MLTQSVPIEAPDDHATDPGTTQEPGTGSICSVVQEFLRNDPGFSSGDIEGYVNTALQLEAAELWLNRAESLGAVDVWRRHVVQGTGGFEEIEGADTAELARRFEEVSRQESDQYTRRRTDFAAAVTIALHSGRVPLGPRTCRWVVRLDHDGHLSASLGFDAGRVFGSDDDDYGVGSVAAYPELS